MPDVDGATTVEAPQRVLRYIINDALVIEQRGGGHVTVLDTDTNRRTRLSEQTYRLVLRFSRANTVRDVLGDDAAERASAAVSLLLQRGVLHDADAIASPVRGRAAVAYRFCNASAWDRKHPVDVVIVGAPYDMGGTLECRHAPALVRQKSLDYPYRLHISTAKPLGWFNGATGSRMLEGVRLSDAGDVPVDHAASSADAQAALIATLDEVSVQGAVPVVLGGDRTGAVATMAWCARREATLAVLLPGVFDAALAQALHGAGAAGMYDDATLDTLERSGAQATAFILLIDAARLHACYMAPPAMETVLRLDRLRAAIRALRRSGRIVAVHVSGWDAARGGSDATSGAVCDLILHAMDAACATERP